MIWISDQFQILDNRIYILNMKAFILFYLFGLVLAQGCSTGEFLCPGSGICIPRDRVCDGRLDCSNGEDEASPNCPCEGFKCPYPDYACVPKSKVCDGIADCLNAEEEQECDCFYCANGDCIPESYVCDSFKDCPSGDDEANCPCDDGFRCGDGMCLPGHWACDAYPDCELGEDENNCDNASCKGFLCANKRCIPKEHACNGQNDCLDGSDEANCTMPIRRRRHHHPQKVRTDKNSHNSNGVFHNRRVRSRLERKCHSCL